MYKECCVFGDDGGGVVVTAVVDDVDACVMASSNANDAPPVLTPYIGLPGGVVNADADIDADARGAPRFNDENISRTSASDAPWSSPPPMPYAPTSAHVAVVTDDDESYDEC